MFTRCFRFLVFWDAIGSSILKNYLRAVCSTHRISLTLVPSSPCFFSVQKFLFLSFGIVCWFMDDLSNYSFVLNNAKWSSVRSGPTFSGVPTTITCWIRCIECIFYYGLFALQLPLDGDHRISRKFLSVSEVMWRWWWVMIDLVPSRQAQTKNIYARQGEDTKEIRTKCIAIPYDNFSSPNPRHIFMIFKPDSISD